MANDTIKVYVSIRTDKAGSDCSDVVEFDRTVWEAMTEDQRDAACKEIAFNSMEWHWRIVDGE